VEHLSSSLNCCKLQLLLARAKPIKRSDAHEEEGSHAKTRMDKRSHAKTKGKEEKGFFGDCPAESLIERKPKVGTKLLVWG